MQITREQIDKVAALARLELSEEEAATYALQLTTILGYVDQLAELDIAGVEATSHPVPLACPLREDAAGASAQAAAIMAGAPQQAGGCFLVPRIIE